MSSPGAKIASGIAEASLIGSSLTGAVARTEEVKQPEHEPIPVEETIPYKQEDPEEPESSIFVFEEDELPSILKEEEKAEEEINKPITEQEIKEVVEEPPSVFGAPESMPVEGKEEVISVEEQVEIPSTVMEILETAGLYDGKFVESKDYMPLPKLKFYEVERRKLDERLNVHTNGNYLDIITVPMGADNFPEDYFVYTRVDINEYSKAKNQQKREDYYYNSQFENIKGLGFAVDEIITFKGPSGDILEFGKVPNKDSTVHYILMRGIDSESQKKDYISKEWANLDPREYGYRDAWEFDKFVYMVLSGDIREKAEEVIERQGLDAIGRSGSGGYGTGFFTYVIEANHEWREGLLYKLNDSERREELEKIAEVDPGVKTVLGFVDAINSYPGDDVVMVDNYFKNMYQFNRENYGVEPIGTNNKKYLPETLTKFLLNYRDEEGNSWYDSFLEAKIRGCVFDNIEELTRVLNLLSAGVKIESEPAQPFVFLDLVSEFTGAGGPSLQLFPVKTVREVIPKEFMSSGRENKVISVRNGWGRAFIYKRGWAGINNVLGGDLIIYPNEGGIGYDGNTVGQAVRIFYVDNQNDPENPTYWAIDLNDYEGKARIYKWNDSYDPRSELSYLVTNRQRDIDN